MEDADDVWVTKIGLVYCFERKLFVGLVNAVLDSIREGRLFFPSLSSESLTADERLTERVDDNRNEWVFRFVGRRFRLSYHYCFKTSSTIKLYELVDDDFDVLVATRTLDRSEDVYDLPRASAPEDSRDFVRMFAEMLALRFPRDEADAFARE